MTILTQKTNPWRFYNLTCSLEETYYNQENIQLQIISETKIPVGNDYIEILRDVNQLNFIDITAPEFSTDIFLGLRKFKNSYGQETQILDSIYKMKKVLLIKARKSYGKSFLVVGTENYHP